MLEQRTFDSSPELGITRNWYFDHDTGQVTIEAVQEVDHLLEANKAALNGADESWGDGARVAAIPMNVYDELRRTGIADDKKAFKKFLNDPDNRAFRTRPGRV